MLAPLHTVSICETTIIRTFIIPPPPLFKTCSKRRLDPHHNAKTHSHELISLFSFCNHAAGRGHDLSHFTLPTPEYTTRTNNATVVRAKALIYMVALPSPLILAAVGASNQVVEMNLSRDFPEAKHST